MRTAWNAIHPPLLGAYIVTVSILWVMSHGGPNGDQITLTAAIFIPVGIIIGKTFH